MKIINIIFILVFLISAILQLNDLDPALWIALYLSGAYLSFLALTGRFNFRMTLLAIAIYLVFAVYLFFGTNGALSWITDHNAENIVQSMKADQPWIEETREFFGLLILILASFLNVWVYKFRRPRKEMHVAQS